MSYSRYPHTVSLKGVVKHLPRLSNVTVNSQPLSGKKEKTVEHSGSGSVPSPSKISSDDYSENSNFFELLMSIFYK